MQTEVSQPSCDISRSPIMRSMLTSFFRFGFAERSSVIKSECRSALSSLTVDFHVVRTLFALMGARAR